MAWRSDNDWHWDYSNLWSSSKRHRERRTFAEYIVSQLEDLKGWQEKLDGAVKKMLGSIEDIKSQNVQTSNPYESSWHRQAYSARWEVVPGPTYFVEVPVVQVVEKVIEVPHYIP